MAITMTQEEMDRACSEMLKKATTTAMQATTTDRTSPANFVLIETTFSALEETMVSLWSRWQDEKEYENLADYAGPIKAKIAPEMTFLKMTGRPWGFQFKLDGETYAITLNGSGSYAWKRIA